MICRIENGAVVEWRDMPLSSVPEHKRSIWTEPTYEGEGDNEELVIEGNTVRVVRSHPPITVAQIIAERERRLAMGFNYDFGNGRGVHRIGTTKEDMAGWSEVSTYAGALIDRGDLTTQIPIATDTGTCLVTPPEWRAIEIAAAQFRQPLWTKSFALMAMNPIPADYTNDSYWS